MHNYTLGKLGRDINAGPATRKQLKETTHTRERGSFYNTCTDETNREVLILKWRTGILGLLEHSDKEIARNDSCQC